MRIRAEVIDIRSDNPRTTDRFLVDTNVWFWATYTRAEDINPQYVRQYGGYCIAATIQDAALYRCMLSLAELCHTIERNEWEAYLTTQPESPLAFKTFRRHARWRQEVVRALDEVWETVQTISDDHSAPLLLDDQLTGPFSDMYRFYALDGYDLLMLHAMHAANMTQLLTDDADFGQVPDIQVFTANPYLIAQATQQGRLITRPSE